MKYGNKKVEYNGLKFDSQGEFKYYLYLKSLEDRGTITDLKLQVPFECKINNKKICKYIADFTYNDVFGFHVVDFKGVETALFRLKKKLIEALYNIQIEIVK